MQDVSDLNNYSNNRHYYKFKKLIHKINNNLSINKMIQIHQS